MVFEKVGTVLKATKNNLLSQFSFFVIFEVRAFFCNPFWGVGRVFDKVGTVSKNHKKLILKLFSC